MQYCEKQTEKWGKVLWITTDYAEVGVALPSDKSFGCS